MFNRFSVIIFSFLFISISSFAQTCDLVITGHVVDEATGLPLSFVNVAIQETTNGTTTDDDGNFSLDNICKGEYHLLFSHIGCDTRRIHVELHKDTFVRVDLSHTEHLLESVVVEGKKNNLSNQPNLSVNRQNIEDNASQTLSGLLENETGVSLIKNGNGISKPVVHGLYGNRLSILNNGILQSGQQWGNDHSPEIDPFAADKITVLKGATALEYNGGNLGGIILVEPKRIDLEEHIHGQVNYSYESNGRGNVINTRLEKYSDKISWRLNGTFKKYGDRKTSNYFLNNTGSREANFSLQLQKTIKEKLFLDFYASTFNTTLGVLRGSHVGSPTDLQQAIDRETPFFTESSFSNAIDAPKQEVSHHLVKFKAKYFSSENKILEWVVSGQLNDRKEFDIRRGNRTERAALNLEQYTINSELSYAQYLSNDWKLKLGNQTIFTDNTNDPRTGILPLIPDYASWKSGLYGTLSKDQDRVNYNFGIRYDFEYQDVATIGGGVVKEIIRFDNRFHNLSAVGTLKYSMSDATSLSYNIGYAQRNPAINELYSNGLHQGVSGIERGDHNLNSEKGLKNTLEFKWVPDPDFSISILGFHQSFDDYIFLNPADDVELTIRGAFQVFQYEQTDASISGLDVSSQFTIGNSFLTLVKYSYLKGQDTRNDIPLVFMPPNRLFASLVYRVNKPTVLFSKLKLEETEIAISNKLVFEQKNILTNQDFLAPPPGYNLFGLKLSTNVITSTYKVRCFVKADNLFNIQYRDYLNRQRYFADDLGRSITFGLNVKF